MKGTIGILYSVKKQAFVDILNEGMFIDTHEYMRLYNSYARKAHKRILKTENDIFTEHNRQDDMINYIMMHGDNDFAELEKLVNKYLFEE